MLTLVGEDNPHSADPRCALWPDPPGCSGWRLCYKVLGYTNTTDYIRAFARVNLCTGTWSTGAARARARELTETREPLILLGAKVAHAFELDFLPFSIACHQAPMLVLPHPSGLSRAWNAPGAYARARAAVAELESLMRESKACR